MSAATIIEQAFGEDANLYTNVLNLPNKGPSITASQLRKAYYRQALKYHPDKQAENSDVVAKEAKLKFQAISVAYSILSDEERRTLYDESGEMDDTDEIGANTDEWTSYFKGIFGKVTTSDIDRFTESYKCSEEEEKDVLKYYTQFKGDLDKMLECVMCSDDIDKKRWVEDYIKPAIQKETVADFMTTVENTLGDHDHTSEGDNSKEDDAETETEDDSDDDKKGRGKKRKVAAKAKKTKPSKKKKNEPAVSEDLVAAIRGRSGARQHQGSGSILDRLEERYAPKSKSKSTKKKKAAMEDIPNDEFEKIQKRLDAQRKRKK